MFDFFKCGGESLRALSSRLRELRAAAAAALDQGSRFFDELIRPDSLRDEILAYGDQELASAFLLCPEGDDAGADFTEGFFRKEREQVRGNGNFCAEEIRTGAFFHLGRELIRQKGGLFLGKLF